MNKIYFSITALGISSVVVQLMLIREFFNIFYGNELMFGIILANWMLLNGIGSFVGKYMPSNKKFLAGVQIFIALFPTLSIYLTRSIKSFITYGILANPIDAFIFSFLILFPYCIFSGAVLTLACKILAKKHSIGKIYFIDNVGDILGGILFTFVFIFFLNPFQITYAVMLLNLFAASLLLKESKKFQFVTSIAILVFIGFLISLNLDFSLTSSLYPGKLIEYKDSPYGRIVVTKGAGQYNFFENGIPLFSTENTISNEETVHYAMVQHPKPKNVLLISGGIAGTVNEIEKYNVSLIDYVELDPTIITIGKKYTNFSHNINTHIVDGRLFVRTTKNKYDIAIIDLPDPSTSQINRFYSKEFFNELKSILNKDGVVSVSLSSSENYIGYSTRQMNAIVYNTLSSVFDNVIVIPGDKNYFIASDSKLSYNIGDLIQNKNITTKYVSEAYLMGKVTEERVNTMLNAINMTTELNSDFKPLGYFYYLMYWFEHYDDQTLAYLGIIGLVFLLLLLYKMNKVAYGIFSIGFVGLGLDIILIIGFQVIYGYAYYMLGVITIAFMAGLAIGSHRMNKNIDKKGADDLLILQLLMFFTTLATPFTLLLLSKLTYMELSVVVIPLLVLIISMFVGMAFPLASKLHKRDVGHTAGTLYAADFIGSCVGGIIISVIAIPMLGLYGSSAFLLFIILASVIKLIR